jgi:DNA-binding NtrC family response regulator
MLNYYDLGIFFPSTNRFSSENPSRPIADYEPDEEFNLRSPCCLIFAADENIRFLYKTLLEIWNYEVLEAKTAEETLRLTDFKHPDVILMDTKIDFFDSLLTMKKLKSEKAFAGIPFILLSGHAQAEIRDSAINAGATHLCVKPVDFSTLEKILDNCLEQSRLPPAN